MALRKKIDERNHRLTDVVSRQTSWFTYEYDFGDQWTHELLVENILSPQPGVRLAILPCGRSRVPAGRRRRSGRIREPAGGDPQPQPSTK